MAYTARGTVICCMYNVFKNYSQGIIIFASSSVDGFYIKLKMNLTFCAVYCGMIRQYSQSSIQFPHPT
jgi:hypothetical protein